MAFQSQFHMPGTYQGDGVHPDIFRTPAKSPCSASSSGYLPSRATVTGLEDDGCTKRKRLHDDGYSARVRGQGQQDAPNVFNNPFLQHTTNQGPSALRPYTLAGNLHTPSSEYNDGSTVMGESLYSDSDYRRMLGTKRPREDVDMAGIQPLSLQPIQQQQYTDQQQQQIAQSQGWGAFAFATLGGVVGRLWQFCKAGTFQGFHAGGGRGYDVAGGAEDVPMAPHDIFNAPDLFQKAQQPPSTSELPREPPNEFGQIDSRSSSPVAPAAKRRQTEFSEELGRNWVMVGNSDSRRQTVSPYRHTPRNRNHAPSVATGRRISTPNARRSMASQVPLLNTTPTSFEPRQPSSASYASPRSPSPTKIPNPSASASFSTPRDYSSHRPRPSIGGSQPKPSHRRTNSGASVASARVSRSFTEDPSPRLDAEARKLAARRKRDDDDTDYRIEAFNKQLQDMIRQGKEALGTTIEVENGEAEGGEGGWEDYDGF